MNTISAIGKSHESSLPKAKKIVSGEKSKWDNFINSLKSYAGVIDSRESTYRTALDITAFDIPTMGAAAFRNIWNFFEASLEALMGTIMVIGAPKITSYVGKIAGKFILKEDEQKDTLHYLRFQMSEVTEGDLKKGIKRIQSEEPNDQRRVADLYREVGFTKMADDSKKNAGDIEDFCRRFESSEDLDEKRSRIYKLKRATILAESFIEGGVWGAFGLIIRAFRKYVIKQERFTGTIKYTSDAESEQLGEGGELNLFQKIGGTLAIFLSPVLNATLLNKTKDKNEVKKSRFLSVADSHLDMTHGVFPKLGLLFSYTSVPKWSGIFITSQGWYERIERIIKFCTILPSWWLGHRITNGLLAKYADKKLSEKYNTKKGILIEEEYLRPADTSKLDLLDKLKYLYPEPARIHHVLESIEKRNVKHKDKLLKEAKSLHAKCLYTGFALHSFLVWVVTMLVNYSTKWRVEKALGR